MARVRKVTLDYMSVPVTIGQHRKPMSEWVYSSRKLASYEHKLACYILGVKCNCNKTSCYMTQIGDELYVFSLYNNQVRIVQIM